MFRRRHWLVVVAVCALVGGAVTAVAPAHLDSAAATCSAAQKALRQLAAQTFQRQEAAKRRQYFRTHRSAKARAAFVKKQQATLAALRRAAACPVPAPVVPPSSAGPACSPQLSSAGNPTPYNEGTDTSPVFARSTGQLHAVILFADTADMPRTDDPKTLYDAVVPDMIDWYKEVSYGRLAMTVTPVLHWLRLPKDSSAYTDQPFDGDRRVALQRDAVAAADPEVDFSNVDLVYIVATPLRASGSGGAGGAGATADGKQLRAFAVFNTRDAGRGHVIIHETGHTLGLPHASADFWDPMGQPSQGLHFLGWHRWKLHWLDPGQIRCLSGPGTLEETLTPIELAAGVKLLVAQTGPSTAVAVELRRPIGRDSVGSGGLIVTKVDATANDAQGLTVETGGRALDAAALKPGESVTIDSVTVNALAATDAAARVRITRTG
jgi:M6 family metalloprotease-like protein